MFLRLSSLSNDPPCDTHFYYKPKIPLYTALLCYWPNHPRSKSEIILQTAPPNIHHNNGDCTNSCNRPLSQQKLRRRRAVDGSGYDSDSQNLQLFLMDEPQATL